VDFPIPPAKLATQHSDPRIAKSAKQIERLDKLAPPMQAIHPIEACYPQECVVITQMDFQSVLFQTFSLASEYIEWYTHSNKHTAYQLHKKLLQIWQSTIPTTRWGLKAPNHMHGIDALMATYPDARMIWSHRDPLVCIPSIASLSATFLRPFTKNLDPHELGRYAKDFWLAGVNNMMAYDMAQADPHWCHHMYYDDLIADPVATLGSAYSHFGDVIDPLHERKINAWVQQRPKNTFGIHKYSLEDFGLNPQEMREQFAAYIERYKVPAEYKG
jgi:Sulfotransferase family